MSTDHNQGTNIKLFPELCCSKGLISLLIRDITVKLFGDYVYLPNTNSFAGSKTVDDLRSSTNGNQSLIRNKGLVSGKDPPTEDQGKRVRQVMSSQQDIVLTDNGIPQLRNKWREKYAAIFGSIPLELPPFREVNHEINLLDPDK